MSKLSAKEVTEEAPQEEVQEAPKHHEVGDLTLKCGQCGNIETLQSDIPGGISFILATIEKAEVKMKCGECENEIVLFFDGMSDERDVEYIEKRDKMEEQIKQEQEALQTEAKAEELTAEKEVELTDEENAKLAAVDADFLEKQEATPEIEAEDEAKEEGDEEEKEPVADAEMIQV